MSPSRIDLTGGVLDTNEAAAYVGIKAGTLRGWRHEGHGPKWFKLGPRKVGYLRSELDAWLRDQIRGSEAS